MMSGFVLNVIERMLASYNKCDAIDILRELSRFVNGLPALTKDEDDKALKLFAEGSNESLREIREQIISERKPKE